MSDTMPLAEVRRRFSEVVDRVVTSHERVVVTRNGRPVCVLLSPDDLAALEQTVAVLSDPHTRQRLEEARAAVATGDVATEGELQELLAALRRRAG